MFGDYDAFIVHPVEKGQALLFEFRSADAVHIQIIAELDVNIDQSLIMSTFAQRARSGLLAVHRKRQQHVPGHAAGGGIARTYIQHSACDDGPRAIE